MENILSQYLLKQTSLKDFLPFDQFCELAAPSGSRNASIISKKQLRVIYHALLNQDYERQQDVEENLEGFLQQLRETEVEQTSHGNNGDLKNSSYNEINDYTKSTTIIDPEIINNLVDKLTEELENRTSSLEEETESEIQEIDEFIDSFIDLRYSSDKSINNDTILRATKELTDLNDTINNM